MLIALVHVSRGRCRVQRTTIHTDRYVRTVVTACEAILYAETRLAKRGGAHGYLGVTIFVADSVLKPRRIGPIPDPVTIVVVCVVPARKRNHVVCLGLQVHPDDDGVASPRTHPDGSRAS